MDCSRENSVSKSTLAKHKKATKEFPYFIKDKKLKFYYSDNYIDVTYAAVPIEKSMELLSGNIGETPEMDNTEINIETKESISS